MKSLATALCALGILSMLFGFVSCVHYYAVNPPPEASQSGWNPDAQSTPFNAFNRFFYSVGGGIVAMAIGFYLAGKVDRK